MADINSGNITNPVSTYEFLSNSFGYVAVIVVLIILGISTLRSVLAYSNMFRGTWLERYIYDDKDVIAQLAVEKALMNLGITSEQVKYLQITSPPILAAKAVFETQSHLDSLFFLLANHTYEFEQEMLYGTESPATSRYYINTMEASLSDDECHLMADLLYQLYIKDYAQTQLQKIDFVIVPKMGNPTLAKRFADICNAVCIICKGNNDHSRIKVKDDDTGIKQITNFEGFSALQEKARRSSNSLNGVVVDCNCSGGSSLIRSAKDFNEMLNSNSISSISKINNAYVLFRADREIRAEVIDKKFSDSGLSLHRYIDLNEGIKNKLRKLGTELKKNSGEKYSKKCIAIVREINNIESEKSD